MAEKTERSEDRRLRLLEGVTIALIAFGVLAASCAPFVWAEIAEQQTRFPEKFFTGSLKTYIDDAASYWSWMRQAKEGRFFFTDLYTSEEHPRNYVNVFFWALGRGAALTGMEAPAFYNLSRVILGGVLLGLLYLLCHRMFDRPMERVVCFFFLVLSSGWEGVAAMSGIHVSSPIWWTPEMNTFYSLLLFPHFVGGFIAMLLVVLPMVAAWSPARSSSRRELLLALGAGISLFVLTFFHPYDAVTMLGAVWTAPVLFGLQERRWPWREWRLSLVATLVWFPAFLYNLFIFLANPAMRAWDLQNIMVTPEPRRLAIALGVSGLLALLALTRFRSLPRRHLVMAAWLLSTLIIIHLPVRFQRRMIGGIQFPVAVLATAAIAATVAPKLEGFSRTSRRLPRGWAVIAAAMVLAPVQVAMPYYTLRNEWYDLRRARYPSWLRTEEIAALRFLSQQGPPESTVLASYELGMFVPPFAGHRSFLGHYALTIDAEQKAELVERFFSAGREHDAWRIEFLERWSVRYILVARFERELGFDPTVYPWLEQVRSFGDDAATRAAVYTIRIPERGESVSKN